jgi:hypothetical protein
MAKKNAVFETSSSGSGATFAKTWTAIKSRRAVTCDSAKIPEPTRTLIYHHGLNAKVGDAAAIQNATDDEKLDAMQKVINALYAGEWRGEREPSDQDLIDAILETNKKFTREKVTEDLRKMSTAEKSVLRVEKSIKTILDRNLEIAAKKSTIDPAALLKKFIHG